MQGTEWNPEAAMATLTSNRMSAGTQLRSPMNLIAAGWGLTCALVGLFVICFALAYFWPTSALAHGWIKLFASEPDNIPRTFVEGVLGSAVAAWLAAAIFVPVYNRLAGR